MRLNAFRWGCHFSIRRGPRTMHVRGFLQRYNILDSLSWRVLDWGTAEGTAGRTAARSTDLLGQRSTGSPRWEDSWEDSCSVNRLGGQLGGQLLGQPTSWANYPHFLIFPTYRLRN